MKPFKFKNFFKIISFCVMFLIVCITGCSTIKYHAKLYDNAIEWIKEDFIKSNPTSGAFYDDMQTDESYPASRTMIIKSEEEKLGCFNNNFDVEVDFEKEMLIIYTWTTVYHRDCRLKGLKVTDGILWISYSFAPVAIGVGDVSRPFQRWVIIKLDLLAITLVRVEEI